MVILASSVPVFWQWILALIVFILVLGLIIALHEAGHLFFAKKAGILCHEYAIGMGPVIKQWKKKGKETAISVRAIPFGGFVSMAGEDTNETLLKIGDLVSLKVNDNNEIIDIIATQKVEGNVKGQVLGYDLYSKDGGPMYIDLDVDGENRHFIATRDTHYVFSPKERIQIAPYDRCFESKKWFPRFITVFGGPLMNFVIALVLFLIVGMITGVSNAEDTILGGTTEYYPASRILQKGDKILKIGEYDVTNWSELSAAMANYSLTEVVNVTYQRDGKQYSADIETVIVSYKLGIANFDNDDIESDGDYIMNKNDKGVKVSVVYSDDYVASKAGIKNGDIILGYYDNDNFIETNDWKSLVSYIEKDDNLTSIKLKVLQGEEEVDITSSVWTTTSLDQLGVGYSSKTSIGIECATKFSFFGGIGNAFVLFWNSITTVFKTLWALFSNSQIHVTDLSGPVGIFQAVKSYLFGTDFITFISFVALISANIGVVNLLPIPALDGGRILFLIIEGITKKKINKKVETVLNNVVFVLVMILFVFITIKDIFRLF